jgi:hypothetical protein
MENQQKNIIQMEQAQILCKYSLNNRKYFTEKQANEIKNHPQTMHLFAYKEPMEAFNISCLKKINNTNNPVAKISPVYYKVSNPDTPTSRAHFNDKSDQINPTYIARGCKVELRGKNLCPQYGLYNGAMGTVIDIVYSKNQSPSTHVLPKYVLVHFPHYTGPQFLQSMNNVLPITPITSHCRKWCCQRKYIPLQLCYAKTIHTFQGQSAGPVAPNQQPNAVQRIVINIGSRKFEGQNPGLTYTALSRATSLGNPNDVTTSSLFFEGIDITPERFINIATSNISHKLYKSVHLRNIWVQKLKKNRRANTFTKEQICDIFLWAQTYQPTTFQIETFFSIFYPNN